MQRINNSNGIREVPIVRNQQSVSFLLQPNIWQRYDKRSNICYFIFMVFRIEIQYILESLEK